MAESKYSEKLKDPRWQKKRLEIFERDNWACQICYDTKSTLAVHHRRYLPVTEPWDYPDELLVTLCENCHSMEREMRPEYEQLLLENLREKFFADDLRVLALGFSNLSILRDSGVMASVYEWMLSSRELNKEMMDRYFNHLKERK